MIDSQENKQQVVDILKIASPSGLGYDRFI